MPEKVDRRDRRRVPDDRRRRALASCDGCKGRRVKCERAESEESCISCIKAGIVCQTTLPRKTRIYGSVESLSVRYRALEALVKGLFPDQDTSDTGTLFRLGHDRGIPMPDANDVSAEQHLFQDPGPSSRAEHCEADLGLPDIFLSVTQSDNPFVSHQPKLVDERLIPTTHGVSHYVGPSSSFKFAATIRTLVGQCSTLQTDSHRSTRALRADFANMRISKAIEPRSPEDSTPADASSVGSDINQQGSYSRRTSPPDVFSDPILWNMNGIHDLLPPRNVADALVAGYFDHVHANFPLFHRSHFQQRFEGSWEPTEASQRTDFAWWCCLFLVFVLGAQALEQHDVEQSSHLQKKYIALARQRLQKLVTTSSLQNVQALSLLMLYEHNSGERNTAWLLVGVAASMSISLGLHRDNTALAFDSISRNVRRRVWWTVYNFEHELSVILGRPSGIDDSEVFVGIPEETIIEPAGCPGLLKPSIQLTQLQTRMRAMLYPLPRQQEIVLTQTHTANTASILAALDRWFENLPPHLQPDFVSVTPAHQRAVLLLKIRYQSTKTVATRPYLLLKVNNDKKILAGHPPTHYECESECRALSEACCASAHETLKSLLTLGNLGLLNGTSWLDIYYAYHAVLVVCLDFLARPRDMLDSPQDLERKSSVLSMCHFIRQARLSSTYSILGEVAIEFARIVGAVDHGFASVKEEYEPQIIASRGGHGIPSAQSHLSPMQVPLAAPPMGEIPAVPPASVVAAEQQQAVAGVPAAGFFAAPLPPPPDAFNATGGVFWDFFDGANPESATYLPVGEFPPAGGFGQGGMGGQGY